MLFGAPAKAPFGFHGERRRSGVNELSPQAEARDMELATTRVGGLSPRNRPQSGPNGNSR